jgi:integrase
MQLYVAAGVEVLALHHQRKAQGDNKRPRALSDVYGSLRISELTALMWREIDLSGGHITVRASKTAAGGRTIDLPVLHDQLAALKAARNPAPDDRVCPTTAMTSRCTPEQLPGTTRFPRLSEEESLAAWLSRLRSRRPPMRPEPDPPARTQVGE